MGGCPWPRLVPAIMARRRGNFQIRVRRGLIQSVVGMVGMWMSRCIHGHAQLKASVYALAHRGRDAIAEIGAVDAQRRVGEKQRTRGSEDVVGS